MWATVETSDRQDDLGALLSRLLRVLVEREAPIFVAHRLTMWDYVILSRLATEDGVTQKELALRSRRDPTRLGANLDALGQRALIRREVDQADRRRHLVRISDEGRQLLTRVHDQIAQMEVELLGGLSSELRATLVRAVSAVGSAHT